MKCDEIHKERDTFSKICFKTMDTEHLIRKFYQCEFCSMSTVSSKTLGLHKIIHEDMRSEHRCPICNGGFEDARRLGSHKKVHINNGCKLFCGECDLLVSLIDKLANKHKHESYIHPDGIRDYKSSRNRSRSPIIFIEQLTASSKIIN